MLAETQINNLLDRYAECIDAGDLPGAARLFEHARSRLGADPDQGMVDAARLLDHDRFESVDGQRRYTYRDLTLIDMVGDVSRHLTYPIRSHRAPHQAPERTV